MHDIQVDLKEFERLRQEIDNRTLLGNYLLLAEVTALGAGILIVAHLHEALLGMALVTSYLWLLWLDHTEQVFKIAAYIGLRLSPRLQRASQDALGWEMFRRRLDRGGSEAIEALYSVKAGPGVPSQVTIRPTRNIVRHVTLVFGILPVVLLVTYAFLRYDYLHKGGAAAWGRVGGLVLSLCLWTISLFQWFQFTRSVNAMEKAFLYQYQVSNTPLQQTEGSRCSPPGC